MAKKEAAADRPTPPAARMIPGPKTVKALDPRAQPEPAAQDRPIKVRAKQVGYYDHIRRRDGDVFVIANEQAYSTRWMEVVDNRTRERTTNAKQALERVHDELIGGTISAVEHDSNDDVFSDNS